MEKNIDPIVVLGVYTSHIHTFGSDAVTANTTSEKLQAGCTTAENPNDFSSYCEFHLVSSTLLGSFDEY